MSTLALPYVSEDNKFFEGKKKVSVIMDSFCPTAKESGICENVTDRCWLWFPLVALQSLQMLYVLYTDLIVKPCVKKCVIGS